MFIRVSSFLLSRAPTEQETKETGAVDAGSGWRREYQRCLIDAAIGTVINISSTGSPMGTLRKALLGSLFAVAFAICVALPASAQDRPQDLNTPSAASQRGTLTGKERLGKKWMDEQRIDNCNVPPDKRGARQRPATCPHVPTG